MEAMCATNPTQPAIPVRGHRGFEQVQFTEVFKYLGSQITFDGDCTADIVHGINAAACLREIGVNCVVCKGSLFVCKAHDFSFVCAVRSSIWEQDMDYHFSHQIPITTFLNDVPSCHRSSH